MEKQVTTKYILSAKEAGDAIKFYLHSKGIPGITSAQIEFFGCDEPHPEDEFVNVTVYYGYSIRSDVGC